MTIPLLSSNLPADLQGFYDLAYRWIISSRRSPDTWLVTKGHILKPPYKMSTTVDGNLLELFIGGANDSITICCNRVVASPYRDQIAFFIVTPEDIATPVAVIAPLSKSKQLILEAFPPGAKFTTRELYNKVRTREDTPQAHARRRWKELKYNFGFDVDFGDQIYWRGPSEVPINQPMLRPDDNKLRKVFWNELAENSREKYGKIVCASCGEEIISRAEMDEEEQVEGTSYNIGLIDHRRPVFQGGDDTLENLQLLCQTCNNLKNNTCRRCPFGFKCHTCDWAFPEKTLRLILRLDHVTMDKLRVYFGVDRLEAPVTNLLKSLPPKPKE